MRVLYGLNRACSGPLAACEFQGKAFWSASSPTSPRRSMFAEDEVLPLFSTTRTFRSCIPRTPQRGQCAPSDCRRKNTAQPLGVSALKARSLQKQRRSREHCSRPKDAPAETKPRLVLFYHYLCPCRAPARPKTGVECSERVCTDSPCGAVSLNRLWQVELRHACLLRQVKKE